MAKVNIPLAELKLWWPAFQMGIPVESFGYQGNYIYGEGYRFKFDPEMDSFLVKQGEFLPVADASLVCLSKLGALDFESFTILKDTGQVQINSRGSTGGSIVKFYPLSQIYVQGESYTEDD